MKHNPYKDMSPLTEELLSKDATVVDILTDYRTPCYIYQEGDRRFGLKRIATNVGATLSNDNLRTFIFDTNSNKIFVLEHLSEKNTILETPSATVQTNPLKQAYKCYFSLLAYDGNYPDILEEFQQQGFDILYWDYTPEGQRKFRQIHKEIQDDRHKRYNAVMSEAKASYKLQEEFRSKQAHHTH